MSDTPDSLLTSSQRAFLRGEVEYHPTDDGQGRMTRKRIRERLRPGLRDFTFVLDGYDSGQLTDDDLRTIFSLEGDASDRDPMLNGMRDAIGLVYLETSDRQEPFDFGTRLVGGVNRARRVEHGGRTPPVDVDFDVEELPISTFDEIVHRLQQGEYDSLSEGELRLIIEGIFEHSEFSVEKFVAAEHRQITDAVRDSAAGWGTNLLKTWESISSSPSEDSDNE